MTVPRFGVENRNRHNVRREHHGLQCGFCTPGMIMSAIDMVKRNGRKLDEDTIRHELEGNICRCTGYHNTVQGGAANM